MTSLPFDLIQHLTSQRDAAKRSLDVAAGTKVEGNQRLELDLADRALAAAKRLADVSQAVHIRWSSEPDGAEFPGSAARDDLEHALRMAGVDPL